MTKWIKCSDKLPNELQEVYIHTDCKDCPIHPAMYFKGKFVLTTIIQCDHHYETDEKFDFIKVIKDTSSFEERITHWMKR